MKSGLKKFQTIYGDIALSFENGFENLPLSPMTNSTVSSDYIELTLPRRIQALFAVTRIKVDGDKLLYGYLDPRRAQSFTVDLSSLPKDAFNTDEELHSGDVFEVNVIYDDRTRVIIEDQAYELERGDVILFNRNVMHADEHTKSEISHIFLSKEYFRTWPAQDEMLNDLGPSMKHFFQSNLNDEVKRNKNFILFHRLKDREQPVSFDVVEQLRQELSEKRKGYNLVCRGLMFRFFSVLCDSEEYRSEYINLGSGNINNLVSETKRYLDKNRRRVSWEELSDYLCYSGAHINRQFQKKYGMSIKKYNQDICMEEAANLLLSTNMSVSDICIRIGFESKTRFYSLFEQYYGLTPANYRLMHQRSETDTDLK